MPSVRLFLSLSLPSFLVVAYGLYFPTGAASIVPYCAVVGQSWNSHSGGNSFLVQLELAVHVEDSFHKFTIAAPTTTLLPR